MFVLFPAIKQLEKTNTTCVNLKEFWKDSKTHHGVYQVQSQSFGGVYWFGLILMWTILYWRKGYLLVVAQRSRVYMVSSPFYVHKTQGYQSTNNNVFDIYNQFFARKLWCHFMSLTWSQTLDAAILADSDTMVANYMPTVLRDCGCLTWWGRWTYPNSFFQATRLDSTNRIARRHQTKTQQISKSHEYLSPSLWLTFANHYNLDDILNQGFFGRFTFVPCRCSSCSFSLFGTSPFFPNRSCWIPWILLWQGAWCCSLWLFFGFWCS